ncbi:MAG: hypothetical protein ACXAD7_02460 [Candidatus Kariarchaeaceae archaeon]
MRRGGGMRGGFQGGSSHFNRRAMSSHRNLAPRMHYGHHRYRRRGYYGGYGYSPFSGLLVFGIFFFFIFFAILGPYAVPVIILIVVGYLFFNRNKAKSSYRTPPSRTPQVRPAARPLPASSQPKYHQRPKAKFCKACGVGLLPDSLFCSECGTKS